MMPKTLYRIKGKFQNIGTSWDKLAPNEKNAAKYAYQYVNIEPERMIDVHHYSLEYCLAHSGESINERYRQNRANDIDNQIATMVAKHATKTNLVLYRGVCEHVYKLMIENAKSIKGCDLYEKGFLATSLVKGHEINSRIKLRIYVPAGTKAVYQGNVNYEENFYEIDIMHGSVLKIVSMDEEYINCILIRTA